MRHRLSTGFTGPERASDRSMMKIHFLLYGVALALPGAAMAQAHLPATGARPLEIDFSSDPVLALGARHAPLSQLRSAVLQVLASNPLMAEARARQDEASAVIDEARDRIGPSATASVQSYRVIARKFDTGDTGNLVERTRPLQRTDALLQIEQRVFDFGASSARLRSAEARAQAAGADAVRTRSTLTLEFISTWYEVTSYRALIEVIDAFLASERDLREAVRRRIAAGASAEIERTQMDALFAAVNARRARAVPHSGLRRRSSALSRAHRPRRVCSDHRPSMRQPQRQAFSMGMLGQARRFAAPKRLRKQRKQKHARRGRIGFQALRRASMPDDTAFSSSNPTMTYVLGSPCARRSLAGD